MIVLALLFGLLLGVFINAAANSLPWSRKLERPHCYSCGAPRKVAAWSGLIAWVAGKSNCEYCDQRISVREVIVELIMIGAAVILFMMNSSLTSWLFDLLTVFIFMLIMIIDLENRLILHIVSVPAAVYFAIVGTIDTSLGPSRTFVGGILGFGFFFLLYILGMFFSRWMGRHRGEHADEVAFGFGDVMLALVIGLAVGFPGVIGALLRGILLAGLFSFLYMLIMAAQRRYEVFTPIPYGPFLILGALWVYFRGDPAMEAILGY
jgi:prepilin signal peptidase PulO-like enzyme (type II secretory pathway)